LSELSAARRARPDVLAHGCQVRRIELAIEIRI
jgi:hypothetical protein